MIMIQLKINAIALITISITTVFVLLTVIIIVRITNVAMTVTIQVIMRMMTSSTAGHIVTGFPPFWSQGASTAGNVDGVPPYGVYDTPIVCTTTQALSRQHRAQSRS